MMDMMQCSAEPQDDLRIDRLPITLSMSSYVSDLYLR